MSLTAQLVNTYENITPFQAALLLSLPILYFFWLYMRDRGAPPGPKGLPLVGYWPFLSESSCHEQLRELTKEYGPVYSLRICGKLFIHLGSLKAIREALLTKSECFGGRLIEDFAISFLFRDSVGFTDGEPWKVLRKFFLSKFKEYGMNAVKDHTAGPITDTLNETVEELRELKGSPTVISDLISMKCMMIFRKIIFNDYGIEKEDLKELCDLFGEMMKGLSNTNLLLVGPVGKYLIFPLQKVSWKMKRCNNLICDILANVVQKHKAEYSRSQVENLIHCYIREREDLRKKGDPTAAYFTDKALITSVSQFCTDGVLSVGVFISNFLTLLAEYPEEQEKIYQEILEVIGPERLPTLEDKSRLPQTNAFILEVTRFTDFFPLNPTIQCTKETTVFGHRIPKRSIMLVNMYAANRNPQDFENPDQFNPSRYLSSPNKPRADLPILFGMGKRACIGEGFAMMQTFLFLTTIVQNFRLSFQQKIQGSTSYSSPERTKICAHPRT